MNATRIAKAAEQGSEAKDSDEDGRTSINNVEVS